MTGAPLIDSFGRRITYLRLSVTDRCDLRCAYCMPERMTFLPRAQMLSIDELLRISTGFIDRGITKIRLTGGEPLMRSGFLDLVMALGRKLGHSLQELTLTTNATRLAGFADALVGAGVRRVNISLDTLDRAQFDSLAQVLDGIAAARKAGLQVKINTVALKGINEQSIPDLVVWAHSFGMDLTLIEVMPLGDVEQDRIDHYLPLVALKDHLARRFSLTPSSHNSGGPARYFDVAETGGRLGFITPLTNNFCEACNRIRVTATGQLYACLGGEDRIDLRASIRSDDPEGELNDSLDLAMRIKPRRHHFAIERRDEAPVLSRHMSMTGG